MKFVSIRAPQGERLALESIDAGAFAEFHLRSLALELSGDEVVRLERAVERQRYHQKLARGQWRTLRGLKIRYDVCSGTRSLNQMHVQFVGWGACPSIAVYMSMVTLGFAPQPLGQRNPITTGSGSSRTPKRACTPSMTRCAKAHSSWPLALP